MATTEGLIAPKPLSFEGNVAVNWKFFQKAFEIYRKAAFKNKDPDEIAAALLNFTGEDAVEREENFAYAPEVRNADGAVITPAESSDNPEVLIRKFQELCDPLKNIIMERHTFNTRFQEIGETIDKYVTVLKKFAASCEYGELKNEFIRDRIVCGTTYETVRKQMLKERDLTLRRAIELS